MRTDKNGSVTPQILLAAMIASAAVITMAGCRPGSDSIARVSGVSVAYSTESVDADDFAGDPAGLSKPLPDWVANPAEMPIGLYGTNNCTYPFGVAGQWDYYPDGACWERPGPDGWTRQQQHDVYVPSFAKCSNGPAALAPIRVCRRPFEASPCAYNPNTGPNGCAICVPRFTCT
jgi:hypothetical protein